MISNVILLSALSTGMQHVGTDSFPPMHTLKSNEIAQVNSSFETDTITVMLTNGSVYKYGHNDWDFEDYYPDIDKSVRLKILNAQRTFTKAEHMPEFPGGQDALDKYVNEFCQAHKEDIRTEGSDQLTLSLIVHLHGQKAEVTVIGNQRQSSKLAQLAVKCIQDGPDWIPAMQNGHMVVAITHTKITLK